MVPKSQIDQTTLRFQERTPERQETEAKLSTGSPLTANDPARVQQRINRIMAVEGARVAFAPVEATVAGVLERVLGNNHPSQRRVLRGYMFRPQRQAETHEARAAFASFLFALELAPEVICG